MRSAPAPVMRWTPVALACVVGAVAGPVGAQEGAPPVAEVEVQGRPLARPVSVAGFGDVPLARTPLQATVVTSAQLADLGVASVTGLSALDASVGDAYNAPGYWGSFRVRGFLLDPRANYRRDGMPINAETALLFNNVERVELLKGTSGIQAGVSAPGGLVNLVVKRPRMTTQRTLTAGWSENGTASLALDWNQPLDEATQSALRFNLLSERLRPEVHDAQGHRHQIALAGQTRLTSVDRLEAELEVSRQVQPSVPGFSLLGGRLPSAQDVDPRVNLNNQRWSQPVVFDGQVASLRWTHELGESWRSMVQLMGQHLRTDDRAAFPLGCSNENHYASYCSDGQLDLYDFRSLGERRTTTAAAWTLEGDAVWAGLRHQLSTGVLWSDYRARLGPQGYEWAGVGSVDGSIQVDPAPTPSYANVDRTERSTEVHLRDVVSLTANTQLWLGVRHTWLDRASVNTDGSEAVAYRQAVTTPWVAVSYALAPQWVAYASWGQGVETSVVPNQPTYANAGQPLAALKSRQTELGLKFDGATGGWSLGVFDIHQPKTADAGTCAGAGTCQRVVDGEAHHLGLEGAGEVRWGAWSLQGSAMWLRARRQGSATASLNGLVPENVAERAVRAQLGYQWASGWAVQALVSHEGSRMVLPDNSLSLPSWTTLGLATRYTLRTSGHDLTLRAGVDNLADRRAWKESPYQYGHTYLYPLEPRTFRVSVQMGL